MKQNFSLKAMAMVLTVGLMFLAASCEQNEFVPEELTDRVETLTLRLEGGTKVSVDDNGLVTWTLDDEVAILTTRGIRAGRLEDINNPNKIYFSLKYDDEVRTGYAVYPYDNVVTLTTSSVVVNYPDNYNISSDLSSTEVPIPMVAVNDPNSGTLYFKHIGGIIRITTKVPVGTSTIAVTTTGSKMCGEATVTNPGADNATSSISTGTNTVTFTVSASGLSSAQDVVLNIPVPCGTFTSLKVEAKNSSNKTISVYSDQTSREIGHKKGKKINADLQFVFSVADNKQVIIAHGNLKVENGVYSVFENDYTFGQRDNWNAATRDLFTWAEASSSLTIGGETGYRVLTHDEWVYLIENKTSDNQDGVRTGYRYAKAEVCDTKGLIIFPDFSVIPDNLQGVVNIPDAPFEAMIDANQWASMLDNGAVFLPCAGRYDGSEFKNLNTAGFYLSTTSTDESNTNTYLLRFVNNNLDASSTRTVSEYFSVRPVRDI